MDTRLKSLEFAFEYDRWHSAHHRSVDELITIANKFNNYLIQSDGKEYFE